MNAERIERQRAIAWAIRGVLKQVQDAECRQMLADRALLIEVADSPDDVLKLLGEVAALGMQIERLA